MAGDNGFSASVNDCKQKIIALRNAQDPGADQAGID
jgi:hypothetical protein